MRCDGRSMWAVRAFEISELGTYELGRGPESCVVMSRRAEAAERERSLGEVLTVCLRMTIGFRLQMFARSSCPASEVTRQRMVMLTPALGSLCPTRASAAVMATFVWPAEAEGKRTI